MLIIILLAISKADASLCYSSVYRFVLNGRKSKASDEPNVSWKKPNNSESQTRVTSMPSSVYEVVDRQTDADSSAGERDVNTSASSDRTQDVHHDYQNTSISTDVSQENVNDYDRLDVDVVGERSPYSKIEL